LYLLHFAFLTLTNKPLRALQQNIKNISETEQELEIIFSAEEFAPEYDKELTEAKKSIQIKGFRKGHAPLSLIKKLAGPSIEATIAEKMASEHFQSSKRPKSNQQAVQASKTSPLNPKN